MSGKMQIEQQRLALDQQDRQARLQMDQADLQAKREMEARQLELGLHDIEIKREDLAWKRETEADKIGFEREKHESDMKGREFDQMERKYRMFMDRRKQSPELEDTDDADEIGEHILTQVAQGEEAARAAVEARREERRAETGIMMQAIVELVQSVQQSNSEIIQAVQRVNEDMARASAESNANTSDAIRALGSMVESLHRESATRDSRMMSLMTAPKRTMLVRDDSGKPVGSMTETLN